jgi:hypothetical protein
VDVVSGLYEFVYRDLLGGAEEDHETTHDIWSLLRYLNPEPPKFLFDRNISASNYIVCGAGSATYEGP